MRILMISRATLYLAPRGDTVQIENTAKYLKELGVAVDIKLTHEQMDYTKYNLIHFFNIIRPSDILGHIKYLKIPYVVSPIFVEFDNVEKLNGGIRGLLYKLLGSDGIEYIKTLERISIRKAVETAYAKKYNCNIKKFIFSKYTWEIAAKNTLEAYKKALQCK